MTAIKERPILFSGPMVRALLNGTKTQTRRVVKHPISPVDELGDEEYDGPTQYFIERGKLRTPARYGSWEVPSPFGLPGDRLWVKEAWRTVKELNHLKPSEMRLNKSIYYEASGSIAENVWGKYRNARFMLREFSRILLEIVSVRVERLQDISEADAKAEGATQGILRPYGIGDWQLEHNIHSSYKEGFQYVWHTVHGSDSWEANPWVWVVEFKRL